ncbi:MAG: methyltransferase domain-containing protein [Patescibacteria group bacterium]|jgi:cyclopropane fatty-acyl-phospholipid synthase-like methyltransferase
MLYFVLSIEVLLIILLLIFIISFGIPFVTGAPFAPSAKKGVKKMIELANIKDGDVAVDLGSGDGRIVIALAKAGAEAHGYEINRFLAWYSMAKIRMHGLEKKAFIHRGNFFKEDLSKYNVVIIFGIFNIMKKLGNKLREELKPNSTIICNNFSLPNWEPINRDGKFYVYKK